MAGPVVRPQRRVIPEELYDLSSDKQEEHNVSGQRGQFAIFIGVILRTRLERAEGVAADRSEVDGRDFRMRLPGYGSGRPDSGLLGFLQDRLSWDRVVGSWSWVLMVPVGPHRSVCQ